ncbi:hypothetical protein Tco_1030856 [Tanacetum coccineum]|uniref:Uncharacterized protein n=1 Tax=Tanacetum coccineum TaxID=301880 RepID=A0ABQ5G7D8_9ASTR
MRIRVLLKIANSGDTKKTANSGVANSYVANSATTEVANSDIVNSATTEIANSDIANSLNNKMLYLNTNSAQQKLLIQIANSDIANLATTKIANSGIANSAKTEIANSDLANSATTEISNSVRRSDDKEYEFSYAYLPRLSLNDVEDMYLLQVQDKLHHLPLELVKDFNNALLIFIKKVMIQYRVEYIQLGVESYQETLNLTKPMMFFEGIDQSISFTMYRTHKGVVYLNQYNVKSFMKLSEVKKFCDGTLNKIRENLIDMVTKNKLGTGNKRLKGRDWTDMDVKKSHEMIDKIDKVLKRRKQIRRLEEYVGGRPKTINPRTFVRPV